jgi:hypothetical protein
MPPHGKPFQRRQPGHRFVQLSTALYTRLLPVSLFLFEWELPPFELSRDATAKRDIMAKGCHGPKFESSL